MPAGLFQTTPLQKTHETAGFKVKGPDGYCIVPPDWHRVQAVNGLALASCARLSAGAFQRVQNGTILPRVLSVSTTGLGAPSPDQMGAYLASASGRAALAHDGRASSVVINRKRITDQGAYVEYTDSSAPDYLGKPAWKGMVIINDRIVLIGLYGGNTSVAGREGEVLIREFASVLIKANTP